MAIKLKTATLVGEFQYILASDPALDTETENFTELWNIFLENGTLPPLKEGQDPTVWTLRPISASDLVTKFKGDARKYGPDFYALQLARYSIRAVTNLDDPKSGEAFAIEHVRGDFGYERISKETDDLIPSGLMVEIGLATLAHSDFS